MAESSRKLVLGFLGGGEVHRDNACALLDDLIAAYLRNNKGAEVVMYLAVSRPYSRTMADLADYCLTSGYHLGFIGHTDMLNEPDVKLLRADAVGRIIEVNDGKSVPRKLVSTLGTYGKESRLIIIADPDEDDDAYLAVTEAVGMGVPVRTLLNGLDMVVLETDDEEETPDMPVHDDDELEEEFVDEDDDELEEDEDVAEPDEDDIEIVEVDEDEGEDVDEGEIVDADVDEGDDTEEGDVGGVEDLDDDSDQAEDEESAVGEEEEVAPVKTKTRKRVRTRAVAPAAQAPVKMTEAGLTRLYEKDHKEFYELAAQYGVKPGRGLKIPTLVGRILEAAGGASANGKPAPVKKVPVKAAAKKAPTATTGKRQSPRSTKPALVQANTVTVSGSKNVAAALKLIEAAKVLLGG